MKSSLRYQNMNIGCLYNQNKYVCINSLGAMKVI